MRKCPYCAEEIQEDAVLCRYCHSNLRPKNEVDVEPMNQKDSSKKRKSNTYLIIAFAVLIVLIAIARVLKVGDYSTPTAQQNMVFPFGYERLLHLNKSEIIELLGNPSRTNAKGNSEVLVYDRAGEFDIVGTQKDGKVSVTAVYITGSEEASVLQVRRLGERVLEQGYTRSVSQPFPSIQSFEKGQYVVGIGYTHTDEGGWRAMGMLSIKPVKGQLMSMEFVLIQPGSFQMGSDDGREDERPVHSVTISKPFYIGKYEVTQKQWRDVMGTGPSRYAADNRPVECLGWNDAQEFIHKLNEQEQTIKYRLPTEAEWEFAARGGTQSKGFKFSGSNNITLVAVYNVNETRAVGSRQANELGIHDMSGNVLEWCSDWYGSYADSSQTDPRGPNSGTYRVTRGGSFLGSDCWVSSRNSGDPNSHSSHIGFRLVRDSVAASNKTNVPIW